MNAMDLVSVRLAAIYRADILNYASDLLDPRELGDSALVAQTGAPLLKWAGDADDSRDLAARMSAMSRAHTNDQARLHAQRRDPGVRRLTPEEFLAKAADYYSFIAGSAA